LLHTNVTTTNLTCLAIPKDNNIFYKVHPAICRSCIITKEYELKNEHGKNVDEEVSK